MRKSEPGTQKGTEKGRQRESGDRTGNTSLSSHPASPGLCPTRSLAATISTVSDGAPSGRGDSLSLSATGHLPKTQALLTHAGDEQPCGVKDGWQGTHGLPAGSRDAASPPPGSEQIFRAPQERAAKSPLTINSHPLPLCLPSPRSHSPALSPSLGFPI